MKHPQVEEIAARTNWNFEDALLIALFAFSG